MELFQGQNAIRYQSEEFEVVDVYGSGLGKASGEDADAADLGEVHWAALW